MDVFYKRIEKMLSLIGASRVRSVYQPEELQYLPCDYKKPLEKAIADSTWQIFNTKNDTWGGGKDLHAWFHTHITVPESMKGKSLRLTVETERGGWDANNPQFIVYIDGKLQQGFDTNHRTTPLDAEDFDLLIYAYTGNQFPDRLSMIVKILEWNEDCNQLYYDLRVPYDVMAYNNENSKEYMLIRDYLNNAVDKLDCREINSPAFDASVRNAIAYMHTEFYGKYTSKQDRTVIGIGHTHIDVAWMWTLAQTREKVQRSFSTVVHLMKRYPEYKFMSSQAQLYKYCKEEAPELYEEIKQFVKEGRWEVEGAMWVEADCNLSSGESLVRQVMYGKQFFRDEFGVDNHILWLPDVFGYSAALPQILQKCGVDRFVTSKISWNDTNKMPHDIFTWQGIDGTEIFSYFLTARAKPRIETGSDNYTTYVAQITAPFIQGTYDRLQDKNLSDEALITFGWGDGGGGPTEEMLEHGRRLAYGIPGCANSKIEKAGDFLDRLYNKVKDRADLPKWVGELYLEFHRGTYTTMAKNKRNNRKSEYLLQNTESLCFADTLLNCAAYPKQTLHDQWETVLLNQFHDIIPGSSIKEVYEDSDKQYAQLLETGEMMRTQAELNLKNRIKTDGGLLVFNPNGFANSGLVATENGSVYAENIPAKGYAVVQPKTENLVTVSGNVLETPFVRIAFDEAWQMADIYDKQAGRHVMPEGAKGNVLEVYEDIPFQYDAWNIEQYHKRKVWVIDGVESVETVRDGVRTGVKITRKYLSSTFVQTIWANGYTPRIDIENEIDWHQQHLALKVAFPVDVNTDKATYDIQFGHLSRPTHANTSWEEAKFEVCAHKYADLSDFGYGMSLMNDCKYGYDIHGNVMRLTLLKGATDPNPVADQGQQIFTYSILPHSGDFRNANAIQQAYDLNLPMRSYAMTKQDGALADTFSLVSADKENIFVDTAKQAEHGTELVVRLYEGYNQSCNTTLTFAKPIVNAEICNMMEENGTPVVHNGNTVTLPVKPFEIVTLKVSF